MMTPEHRRAGGGRVDVVGLLLVCVFLSTVCLGAPLVDPDEPRTAIVARLMVDRGDWLSPHLPAAFHNHYPHDPIEGDLLAYWDKPPLFFWLAALGMKVLGPSALAARLPAAASSPAQKKRAAQEPMENRLPSARPQIRLVAARLNSTAGMRFCSVEWTI